MTSTYSVRNQNLGGLWPCTLQREYHEKPQICFWRQTGLSAAHCLASQSFNVNSTYMHLPCNNQVDQYGNAPNTIKILHVTWRHDNLPVHAWLELNYHASYRFSHIMKKKGAFSKQFNTRKTTYYLSASENWTIILPQRGCPDKDCYDFLGRTTSFPQLSITGYGVQNMASQKNLTLSSRSCHAARPMVLSTAWAGQVSRVRNKVQGDYKIRITFKVFAISHAKRSF